MATKHNKQFIAKLNGKQEHFGFRKFSVGLASVLLGTSFFLMGNGNQAKADTTSDVNIQDANQEKQATDSDFQGNAGQKQDDNQYETN